MEEGFRFFGFFDGLEEGEAEKVWISLG